MSGYCAIGRPKTAMKPPSVMMIESTEAKIGRSMKKRDTGSPHFTSLRFHGFGHAGPDGDLAGGRRRRLVRRLAIVQAFGRGLGRGRRGCHALRDQGPQRAEREAPEHDGIG